MANIGIDLCQMYVCVTYLTSIMAVVLAKIGVISFNHLYDSGVVYLIIYLSYCIGYRNLSTKIIVHVVVN